MRKSELTQLTQIIEHLVAREIRKQLPAVIAETFQKMMGNKQTVVTEQRQPERQPIQEQIEELQDEEINLKASLREMFAGTPVVKTKQQMDKPVALKTYTKNPVLNQILNETQGFRPGEKMGGMAAMLGGYGQSAMPSMTGVGQMMPESEIPSFARGMPVMPAPASVPMTPPQVLTEGQESTHMPLEALPEGISALDVARQIPLAEPVAQALTRNYSQMMKMIDAKKGKKA